MQGRVSRRIPELLTVSRSSEVDIRKAFDIESGRITTIPLGVDTTVFRPAAAKGRVPGRVVCIASADAPLKGVSYLLEAIAKLSAERDVELTLVSKLDPDGPSATMIDALAISSRVKVVSGLEDSEMAELLASAQVACVPSLYEGFSLPAVEAMSCGTPLVATHAGAIPEVVGTDGQSATLVPPRDSERLAQAIGALLDDESARAAMGAAARERVEERYSWAAVAAKTAAHYETVLERVRIDGSTAEGVTMESEKGSHAHS